ncbi:ankyrin repeat domain-containing protein [Pedobacter psychrodurus]|uniref:Ankyrin repeat domain-containing protein n=1 Tax=Pedobacter psychrodurus TaxID=2530456 RepID=A0A4R0Q098_9SPHI|nr:ankyrin repeat domain-containing protein [Pedobacter psychrodurus]TCD25520.1 ankyrin repeat domain-containing protein [Pedobacter psychrodurus]
MAKQAKKKVDKRIDSSFINITDKNNEAVKKLFLEVGINAPDRDGRTLLINASCYDNQPLVEWALKNGADINYQDNGGRTALHFAVQKNVINIIKVLLENNIEVDNPDVNGNTALTMGVYNNCNPEIVTLLVNNGAKPVSPPDFKNMFKNN